MVLLPSWSNSKLEFLIVKLDWILFSDFLIVCFKKVENGK